LKEIELLVNGQKFLHGSLSIDFSGRRNAVTTRGRGREDNPNWRGGRRFQG
jgi:hypothetical protein